MREMIWDYLRYHHQCLIALAEDIAHGVDPHKSHSGISLSALADKSCQKCADKKCPQPINYLANCASPSKYKSWLASESFKFNPCDFRTLLPLATVKGISGFTPKTDSEFCGFNTGGTQGLSILLGPWSDYCLWCWAKHPNLWKNAKPIIILGKDNDIFAAQTTVQTIIARKDWGEEQVVDVSKFEEARDPSTQKLFVAIKEQAAKSGMEACEFIAAKRIFIYNIWPWFRCGDKSTLDVGIHSDFATIPCLWNWLDCLINCLKPEKIAALGSWSYRTTQKYNAPDAWLRDRSEILNKFPGSIDVFRHPSAYQPPNNWYCPWNNPPTWGKGYRWTEEKNSEAFKSFLGRANLLPTDVLDGGVDE